MLIPAKIVAIPAVTFINRSKPIIDPESRIQKI